MKKLYLLLLTLLVSVIANAQTVTYVLHGQFITGSWADAPMETTDNNIWTCTFKADRNMKAEFGLKKCENGKQVDWFGGSSTLNVSSNIEKSGNYFINIVTGKSYKFTLNVSAWSLTFEEVSSVAPDPTAPDEGFWFIKGGLFGNWNEVESMSKKQGADYIWEWEYTPTSDVSGEFGLMRSATADLTGDDFYNHGKSGFSYESPITKSSANNNLYASLKANITYVFTLDVNNSSAKKLTLAEKQGSQVDTYSYSLSGKIFSKDATADESKDFTEAAGVYTLSNVRIYPGAFNVLEKKNSDAASKLSSSATVSTTNLEVDLTAGDAAITSELNGTYTVTYTKATGKLKFEGTEYVEPVQPAFAYHIVGDNFGGWNPVASNIMTETPAGSGIWIKTFSFDATSTGNFKVRDTKDSWIGPNQIDFAGMSASGDNFTATIEANTEYVFIYEANLTRHKLTIKKTSDISNDLKWAVQTPIMSENGKWTEYAMLPNADKTQWTYTFPMGTPSGQCILHKTEGYVDVLVYKDRLTPGTGVTACADNNNMKLDLKNATSEYTLVLDIAAGDKYTLSLNEKTNTYSYTFEGFGNGTFVEKDGVYTLEKVRLAPGTFTVKEQRNSEQPYNISTATKITTAAKTVTLAKGDGTGTITSKLNGIYTVTFNPASKELSFDGPFCGENPTWYFSSSVMSADDNWADYEMTPNADKSQWTLAFPKGTQVPAGSEKGSFILKLKDDDYAQPYYHEAFEKVAPGVTKDDNSISNMWVALNNATSDYTLVLDITADKKILTLNEVKAPEVYVPSFTYTLVDLTGNTFNPDDVKLTPTLGEFSTEGKIENLDLMPGSVKLVVKKDGAAYKSFYCATEIAAQGDAVFDTEIDADQSATVAIDGRYTVTLTPTIANNEVTSVSLNFAGTDRTWPDLYLRGTNYGGWNDATQNPKFTRTRNIYTLELPNGLKGEGKIADAAWVNEFTTQATIAEDSKDVFLCWMNSVNIKFPTTDKNTILTLVIGRGSTMKPLEKNDQNKDVNKQINGLLSISVNEHAISVSGVPMTFYFEKPDTWGEMTCHAWNKVNGKDVPLAEWPGFTVETAETTINGKVYHKVTIPGTAEWMLFNNKADSKQTVDLKAVSGGVYDITRDGVEAGTVEVTQDDGKTQIKRKCYDPFVTYAEPVAATITPVAGGSNEDVATDGSSIFYNTSFAGTEFSITVNVGAGKICLYKAVPLTMTQYKADIDAVMNPRKAAAKNFQEQDVSTFTAVATDENGTANVKVPLNVENQGRLYIATRDNTTGLYSEPTEYWYNAYGDGGIATGVESLEAAEEVQYFNLQGAPVQNPQGGIFIRVSGGKATKVAL